VPIHHVDPAGDAPPEPVTARPPLGSSDLGLRFRQLEPTDLELLAEWFARPHVEEWWFDQGGPERIRADYGPMTDPAASTRGYLSLLDGQPIGFVQCYVPLGSGDGWWEEETDPGARGIDVFLADSSAQGRGLGTAMIVAFVEWLFTDPTVTKVQTDPAPHNARALRVYEKAGFGRVGEVTTPDGPAILMVRRR
jgi:RimJ/RimL family protein N-acetyltransferase